MCRFSYNAESLTSSLRQLQWRVELVWLLKIKGFQMHEPSMATSLVLILVLAYLWTPSLGKPSC